MRIYSKKRNKFFAVIKNKRKKIVVDLRLQKFVPKSIELSGGGDQCYHHELRDSDKH